MLSWQQRIDAAREVVTTGWIFKTRRFRGFTHDDRGLAEDWFTCGCGHLDARIPRLVDRSLCNDERYIGAPIDHELQVLGMGFYDAVVDNQVDRAEILYRKIQARAELLIEQIEQTERTKSTEPEPVETPIG